MSKGMKRFLIGLGIYVVFALIMLFVDYNSRTRNYSNSEEKSIMEMLAKSDIIKNELGEIKSVSFKRRKYYSCPKFGHFAQCGDYVLITNDESKYNLVIVLNQEFTYGIYAYEINNKVIYEDIEKVQPNINVEM